VAHTGAMTAPPPRREDDDAPVLPAITEDEREIGWGDDAGAFDGERRDEEWYRRERPPHHE
jgi:hypothetical protein